MNISLQKVIATDDFIIIRFSNNEIKILKASSIKNHDKHTEKITQKNIWKHIKSDDFSIYWLKYKIYNQPYEIGADNLYQISKKPTKAELIKIIEF